MLAFKGPQSINYTNKMISEIFPYLNCSSPFLFRIQSNVTLISVIQDM